MFYEGWLAELVVSLNDQCTRRPPQITDLPYTAHCTGHPRACAERDRAISSGGRLRRSLSH